ncbi:MAG: D-alanyl-D-alanine carboxypeptidase [Ruminococcaceae bacterium]|nr:D-alanyl-D-alanine carboxypeptidase [Oscillospiraceae bacterium]
MAKTIFQKKKRYNKQALILIAACVVATVLVGWMLVAVLSPEVDFFLIPTSEEADPNQSTQTTGTTTTRPTLPKEFVDKNTYSPHVVLYDLKADQVLYQKAAEKKCYPASLTKLMTALVALDYTKPEDVFTLGSEVSMISPGSSRAWLSAGTKLTMENLLQALLLPSGNDAAYAIAVQVGRVIENKPDLDRYAAVSVFCKKMNAKAKELGCKKTKFLNPDGYHEEGHYTTALDMLSIAKAAVNNPTIKTIMATPEVTVKFLSGQSATWHNSNKLLLPDNAYTYEGAFGLKTGSTDEAGKCLAACATRNGRTCIAIVMGAEEENGRWDDARGLLDLGFQ